MHLHDFGIRYWKPSHCTLVYFLSDQNTEAENDVAKIVLKVGYLCPEMLLNQASFADQVRLKILNAMIFFGAKER